MFVPDKVRTPEPFLVKPTDVAIPFSICPPKLVEALFPPIVRTGVPTALLVILPVPEIPATVSAFPLRSKVPVTVTDELSGMAPIAPSLSVPALMVVAPLYKPSPDNVQVPVPLFVNVVTVPPIPLDTCPP